MAGGCEHIAEVPILEPLNAMSHRTPHPRRSFRVGTALEIFYKDWGPKDGQTGIFHHGWPLSADDWDTQVLYFVGKGYRVIAHDRRGHGRSTQVSDGHDVDHFAADVAAVIIRACGVLGGVHIGRCIAWSQGSMPVADISPLWVRS